MGDVFCAVEDGGGANGGFADLGDGDDNSAYFGSPKKEGYERNGEGKLAIWIEVAVGVVVEVLVKVITVSEADGVLSVPTAKGRIVNPTLTVALQLSDN